MPAGEQPEAPFLLLNRELSWLAFNGRVLQEARDPSVPLFERLGFLSIFSSNLDEFFRVRVASLRSLLRLQKPKVKRLRISPRRLLRDIHEEVHRQQELLGETLAEILTELEHRRVFLVTESAHAPHQDFLRDYFRENVQPLLNPVMLERSAKPFLPNRGLYLVVELWPEHAAAAEGTHADESPLYALVEVPSPPLKRFVTLPEEADRHVVMYLDDLIRHNLPLLFPSWHVGGAYAIKLSRNAELNIEGEFSGDLVEAIRKSLAKRETGLPIRFLYDEQASFAMVSYLKAVFALEDEDLVLGGRYHNLNDLRDFPRFGLDDLSFEPWPPFPHPELERAPSVVAAVAERDQLLHFPYQSYGEVVRFLDEAAADPQVEEIWLTVYRVSRDSAVLKALLQAAERGKKVSVFFEVQARFDEAANLRWGERLERGGVCIMYSMQSVKVHAKMALVSRREDGARRLYAYLGTGNFNEDTARFYTDFGLLTADVRITDEVDRLFRYLAGHEPEPCFEHLLVAPFALRKACSDLIEAEIAAARDGRPAGITLKLNALEDEEMIGKLYEASQAGVPVRIIVRGICCLRPGLQGVSERIQARSIVDRYLEHSRVYVFEGHGDERMYLSSADWMRRNLSHRVEVAFPLYDPEVRRQVREALEIQLADNCKARVVDARQQNVYAARSGAVVRAQSATREAVGKLHEEGAPREGSRTPRLIPLQHPESPNPDRPVMTQDQLSQGFSEASPLSPPASVGLIPSEYRETTDKSGEGKKKKKKDKKKEKEGKKDVGVGTSRGIETMFRTAYQTHNDLSALADNKANIMISINGIVISILIASMAPGLGDSLWMLVPTALLLLGCLTSLVFAVLAARPRVTRTRVTPEEARSGSANILFFGNFVGLRKEDYVEGIQTLMRQTDGIYLNMARDIYSLGHVLERKFRLLRVSYTAFMVGLVAGVLLLLVNYVLTGIAIR